MNPFHGSAPPTATHWAGVVNVSSTPLPFTGTIKTIPIDHLYGNIEFIWLLDLGASRHMTGRFEFLSHRKYCSLLSWFT